MNVCSGGTKDLGINEYDETSSNQSNTAIGDLNNFMDIIHLVLIMKQKY